MSFSTYESKKFFTLIELLITIVVIGILAAIVIVNVKDMKKDSIRTAIQSNTKILQTAVDTYALKNNGKYPVKSDITLTKPQYVDVNRLYPKYIKSEVEFNKIKEQFYWIDVFGTVWGATADAPTDVTVLNNKLEWSSNKSAKGYILYEVEENQTLSSLKNQKVKEVNKRELPSGIDRVEIPLYKESSMYLISTVDEYGLESAPVGFNYGGKGQFPPILSGDGIYEFELDNMEDMYWERFWTIEDKPEGTSITYQFSIKDNKGVYGEWVEDFYSLSPSKGLKIKIEMKSFNGKNPSLYDMRVFYHYKDDVDLYYPPVKLNPPKAGWTSGNTPVEEGGGTGGLGGYPIKSQLPESSGGSSSPEPTFICGIGKTETNVDESGRILDGGERAFVTYSFKLGKNQYIHNLSKPKIDANYNYQLINTWVEYSQNGSSYVKANSLSEIPDESCINIVYDIRIFDSWVSWPPLLFPPSVGTQPEEPKVFVDPPENWNQPVPEKEPAPKGGTPTQPEISDVEVKDSNWSTINTLRFFAHSGDGQITHWIRAEISDVQPENTRILYRYSTSNGYYWSTQVDSISKVSDSRSLMVVAYLQVHKDFANKPEQSFPQVNSIKVVHERGAANLDMVKPTLAIMPVKDNNLGRDVISDTSKIDWQYEAFDPRGRKIIDIEWAGDKRETYPIGSYTVQARVLNESNYWSDWVSYTFEVKQENPIAVITSNPPIIEVNTEIIWSADTSIDPDGDGIAKVEWRGDKKSSYLKSGEHNIELRVQDKEGNWSKWTSKTFTVYEKSHLIYRVEAEDSNKVTTYRSSYGAVSTLSNSSYSNGKTIQITGGRGIDPALIKHTFNGTGVDIYFVSATNVQIIIDGVLIDRLTTSTPLKFPVRSLERGTHTLEVKVEGESATGIVDYLEVYHIDDKPNISSVATKQVYSNGVESTEVNNNLVLANKIKTKTYYTLSKNSYITATIKDDKNSTVKTLSVDNFETGGTFDTHYLVWDGTNSNGEEVTTGAYKLEIIAKGTSKSTSTVVIETINVDNEKPVYRVEAEDSNKVTTYLSSYGVVTTLSNTSYSNGKAIQITGGRAIDPANIKHSFTGTGFDISFLNAQNVVIILNGTTVATANGSSEFKYSLRNLPLQTHNLEILAKGSSSTGIVDFIEVFSSDDTPNISGVISKQTQNSFETSEENTNMIPNNSIFTKTYYTLNKNSYVSIYIKDNNGNVIKTLQKDVFTTGGTFDTHSITWDGKNSTGNIVNSGFYKLEIIAKGIKNSSEVATTKTIYVDNSNPALKIEAEDTTKVSRYSSSYGSVTVQSSSSYSNGQRIYLLGGRAVDPARLNFSFSGTGFDISLENASNVQISVDGVPMSKVTNSNSYTYSLRNLSSGNHNVQILVQGSGSFGYIDYINLYN